MFIRITACPLADLLFSEAFYTKGFEHFIASMPASVATGWSESCRVGFRFLLPLEFCTFPRRTQTRSKTSERASRE